jgi:hypothetical protein
MGVLIGLIAFLGLSFIFMVPLRSIIQDKPSVLDTSVPKKKRIKRKDRYALARANK